MKLKSYMILLAFFLIGLFFRTYKLDQVPYGFHVDEVKVGWNAYTILNTGRDDKGNFMPLYYDSFGDYRPTGLIYFIIPSIIVFGKAVFAVRFPFALAGAMTIVVMYFLGLELFPKKKNYYGLILAGLLALNPWHIVASRATSESVVAMLLSLTGLVLFMKVYKNRKWGIILLSIVFTLSSFLFYHSIRVLAPVFMLILFFYYPFVEKTKFSVRQLVILIVVSVVALAIFISPASRSRMSQVSIKSDFKVLYEVTKMPAEEGPGHVFVARAFHNRIVAYARRLAEEYKEYFGTSFLVGSVAKPIRYGVPQVGLLTYIEIMLVVVGLFYVSKRKELLVVLALLVVAPIPAAVTIEDTPNMQRAFFMVPILLIIGAYGLYELRKYKVIFGLFICGLVANFVYFQHMYFVHQRMSIATYYRDGGNVELVNRLESLKSKYFKIILTNSPDDLYPWLAFGMDKVDDVFVFSKDKCPIQKLMETNMFPVERSLYVEAEGCVYEPNKYKGYKINEIEIIHRPDGSPPYYLRTVEKLLTTPNNQKY